MRTILLFNIRELSASVLLILRSLSINTDHPAMQLLVFCVKMYIWLVQFKM